MPLVGGGGGWRDTAGGNTPHMSAIDNPTPDYYALLAVALTYGQRQMLPLNITY